MSKAYTHELTLRAVLKAEITIVCLRFSFWRDLIQESDLKCYNCSSKLLENSEKLTLLIIAQLETRNFTEILDFSHEILDTYRQNQLSR